MTRTVVVSIINYRTGALTIGCLASVLADLDGIDGHAVVVDNRSDDGSAEEIEAWIAAHGQGRATLVRSATNSGFSGGHNQGIAAEPAEFYLVLNSDAVLRPGFFRAILAAAEAHPDAGLVAPRIEGEDGVPQVSCFRFHNPVNEFLRGASTGPVTRLFDPFTVPLGPSPDPAAIEWASFACILLRGRMVEELGPMDEGYFLYFEDAEYCLRARRAGWRIVTAPDAVAVHFRGGSGPVKTLASARRRLPRYYYSSRTRFFYQAHGRAGLVAANLLWHLGRGLALAQRLVGRKVPVIEHEARDIWTNAARPLGRRHAPGE